MVNLSQQLQQLKPALQKMDQQALGEVLKKVDDRVADLKVDKVFAREVTGPCSTGR